MSARPGLALALVFALACGLGGAPAEGSPAPASPTAPAAPPPAPVSTMRVQTLADLVTAQNRYLEMVATGQPGTLRIVVAAGTYSGVLFQATDPMGTSEVALELLAEGAVVIDGSVVIEAPRVEVRGLRIQGKGPGFRLSVGARDSVTLTDLAFTGGGADPRVRSGTLRVQALGPATALSARNLTFAGASRPVLEVESLPGREFASVAIDGLALGDVTGPALRLSTAAPVTLAGVTARATTEPLVLVTRPPVRVTLERCRISAPTRNGVVQPEVPADGHALQFAPTRLVDCVIDAPTDGDALPGVAG